MTILIKGGRLLNPASNTDEQQDILIENGKIAKIGKEITPASPPDCLIDAVNMWVVPGLIDMHVHLRDPGQEHKETIGTGTRAAAAGGFTTVCCMPNTSPTTDSKEMVMYITNKAAEEGIVNVIPVGSITKGLNGVELSAIEEMKEAGICAISDDGKTVENSALFKTAMELAKKLNLPVLSHCDDLNLVGGGQINAGVHAAAMGIKGIPNLAEEIIISRDIILARATGARLHICHVSTAEGLKHIRAAQAMGLPVTAEVSPHHFTLADEDITELDANFKMSPPLRSKADREALKAALKDGTIGVIATDHAPHHPDEKNGEFDKAPNGVIGLETAVPLCISELVETGLLTPLELAAKLTTNPARILGLDKGHISQGAVADITIIDPNARHKIDRNMSQSKSKNTPFHGREVTGRVTYTIVAGAIVYKCIYSELIPNRSRLSPENALKPALFGSGENRFPLNSL